MKRGHSLDVVMTMVLFCLFAAAVLLVLMLGVRSYQGVVSTMDETYQERTCLQYIATKVRQMDGAEAVRVTTFGDGQALVLRQTIDQEVFVTYLYCHEGMLMELFCPEDVDLGPADGFAILEVDGLVIEQVSSSLLRLQCTDGDTVATLLVGLPAGKEAWL